MKRDRTEFSLLPAFHGDCILIKTFDSDFNEFVILIDGGTSQTFKYSLSKCLKEVKRINLVVLTHIDSDHIGGLLKFLKSSMAAEIRIDEIWMNHPDLIEASLGNLISVSQGDSLLNLVSKDFPYTKIRQISINDNVIIIDSLVFTILSPTIDIIDELYLKWEVLRTKTKSSKKDISVRTNISKASLKELSEIPFTPDRSVMDDIFNASSIAFVLKCPDVSLLLLADSRPEVLVERLRNIDISERNPLVVDYVKISHHGSHNNTSQELLRLIKSNNFLISTNGGTSDHLHPSPETIARIVYKAGRSADRLNVYFNYDIQQLDKRLGGFFSNIDFSEANWVAEHRNNF